ncbi:MAG: TlpA disulfide reductase family protein [Flavobacteriales bacterium]|nr:MAG: TlpA disulfide reductase family protein [Flavobacteriales bacterium]
MRKALAAFAFISALAATAQEAVIDVHAPAYAGKAILLYRYQDLFTLRTERLATAPIGEDGHARLSAPVEGTAKLRLRVGEAFADLYARPGARYSVAFHPPAKGMATSLGGSTRAALVFTALDALDANALTADLNGRIDAFIAEDLATDQAAGMQALEVQRKQGAAPDSAKRPPTLFVMPTWSKVRVDTFEQKVRRYYRDVDDPWFAHYLTYSFAGLRHGPRVNEAELFAQYLKGQPVRYDDPEYVRFIRSFFAEQLVAAERFHGPALARAFELGQPDSLGAILAANDFLRDDARLRELVMIDLLHQQYHGRIVKRAGAEAILRRVSEASPFPEHRLIAANMLWDLTSMRVGQRLPPMRLEDMQGRDLALDSLLAGPVCIVFTASWCSYCDLEMQGLEQLHSEYKGIVPIIAIGLDQDPEPLRRYIKAHPGMGFRWLRAQAEQQVRDDLRLKSLPAVFLLNDGVLARSPAPLPSRGLGAVFHQVKAEAERSGRIKVWDE